VAFLAWLEATGLADWVRVSTYGYPAMITLHSIGLAVMVGPALVLDLRILGWFRDIPLESITRLLGIAWIGFLINFLSGAALFTTQATSYVTNTQFLLKIALVLLGAITAAQLQVAIARHVAVSPAGVATADDALPGSVRAVAVLSIIFWIGAIVTGRLIAYLS
jgi:hypothetical protein